MNKKTVKKATKVKREGKVIDAILVSSREKNDITCKIMEYKQMQAIERELAGQLTDKFCYEFKQGEQTIRGIRAVGVREAVRFCKDKPYCFIPQFEYINEDLGDGYYREVVYCVNPITKEKTRGTCQWKRGDRFSDRIAQTNAERNALLKQLPTQMQIQFINYCIKKGYIQKENVDPAIEENKAAVKALGTSESNEKTALITRIYAIFGSMKINAQASRLWLHKRYKCESVKDLTDEVLNRIIKGLKDIEGNSPGHCAKPKAGTMTADELKSEIEGAKNE